MPGSQVTGHVYAGQAEETQRALQSSPEPPVRRYEGLPVGCPPQTLPRRLTPTHTVTLSQAHHIFSLNTANSLLILF